MSPIASRANQPASAAAAEDKSLLPDFGSFGIAIRLVLLAELIAIIITVGRNSGLNERAWQELNMLSAFALLVSLCVVIALKLASPVIRRMSALTGSLVVFALLLCVTALVTEFTIYMLYDFGLVAEDSPPWRESLLVRSLVIAVLIGIPGLRYLLLQYRTEADAKAQQEAKLQALQSRIRPHFLFNSLNSVASLTRSDPKRAESVLQDLADLFRVLLADARKLVPISAEREISRQYLEIEKMRLGDRLKVSWHVSNVPRYAMIPALTLQPLLENAIYHGIEPRFAGGTVRIELWSEGDMLSVLISNPLPDVRQGSHSQGNKIAQDNIRERLVTQFGDRATMQAFEQGGQYHVKLSMPIVRG
jgi:two-component system, LytTR family, sensor histidine kinase AlgZ